MTATTTPPVTADDNKEMEFTTTSFIEAPTNQESARPQRPNTLLPPAPKKEQKISTSTTLTERMLYANIKTAAVLFFFSVIFTNFNKNGQSFCVILII